VIGSASLVGGTGVAQAQVYVDQGAGFYVGDTVQVYADDGAYDATVLQVSGSSVLVRYLDTAWGGDEWVDSSRLGLVQGGGQVIGYQPQIQVYWGNGWYDGTLLARRGNRYHVRYRGVSEWVSADRWHHRDGSPYRTPAYGARNHGRGGGWNVGPRNGGGDRHGQVRGGGRGGGNHQGEMRGGGRGGGNRQGEMRGGGNRHGEMRGGGRGGGNRQGEMRGGGNRQGEMRGNSRGGGNRQGEMRGNSRGGGRDQGGRQGGGRGGGRGGNRGGGHGRGR
jgi:hypothetical protein